MNMVKTQNYIWRNDRNFDLEDYEKQQYYYVVESNDLITKARHDLSARELKIMDFVISKIQPSDEEFTTIRTSMYELTNVLEIKRNGKNYSDMAKAIGELRKKEVLIYNDEKEMVTQTGWVESTNYLKNGQVEIRLNRELAPHLLGLKDNYTQYLLVDTVKLKSKYAILLYKLIRECDKSNNKKIAILRGTPENFKEWLGSPKEYTYGQFKQNVLNKAIDEINLKINDMDLEIFQARRGRNVVQVEIHNNWTPSASLNKTGKQQITLHNWLIEE